MIRSELIARIAAQNPHLIAKDIEAVVGAILERIAAALADGDWVELRGFGMFEARVSAGVEYSLIVGIENSLVGTLA
ncbi:hypothetical protein MRF4_20700 [Methylobacterium radiotolerans]